MSTDPRIEVMAEHFAAVTGEPRAGRFEYTMARAALDAADKAATITTVEELEALPVRSVILDECGESFQRLDMEGSAVWSSADLIASDLVELPARVIHWGQS